jgi:hypothetical protein
MMIQSWVVALFAAFVSDLESFRAENPAYKLKAQGQLARRIARLGFCVLIKHVEFPIALKVSTEVEITENIRDYMVAFDMTKRLYLKRRDTSKQAH